MQAHYLSAVIQFSDKTNGASKYSNNGQNHGHKENLLQLLLYLHMQVCI